MTMTMVRQFETMARTVTHDVTSAGRQLWFAGLGAVGMAGTTSTTLFGMLVEEGKKYQHREMKRVDRLLDQATDSFGGVQKLMEQNVQATTKFALNKLGMPTRRDVADLSRRVELLTVKLQQVSAPRARRR
jgi:poly(hydroxyalkanoate) granule-associated protein